MVPNEWSAKPLADIVKEKISYGIVQAGPHVPDGIPYIKSSDVRGTINPYTLQRTSQEIHFKYRRSSVHPGDIVFSLRGNIGESAIVPASLPEANLTQGTARISVSAEHSNLFHYYQLASDNILNRINALSKGSTFKEISLEELRKVKVLCAPLPEQNKIAKILSTWDKAITTTEQLLANSQQQKKALMQQLLTGKKRLLDNNGVRFSGEWKHKRLSSLCTIKTGKKDVNEGNPEGNYPFFTCASEPTRSDSYSYDCEALLIAGNGILGKTHYFNGKFEAYQRTYILSEFNGIDVPFLHQFILYWLIRDIDREKQHGAMPYIKLGLLQNFKVLLPCIEEQQKIATVLSTADQEISALQQKLDALKQEKKALMQQLLTGKRRVKVEEVA